MVNVPRHVQARGPDHVGVNLRVYYQPTNTRRDLPRIPGAQRRLPMEDYLLSDQLQDVLMTAGRDMVEDAEQLTVAEGVIESGEYLTSFEARRGDIVEVNDGEFANPRVSTDVLNTAATAAAIEYGNSQVGEGHRILGKIAAQYDNPKGGE